MSSAVPCESDCSRDNDHLQMLNEEENCDSWKDAFFDEHNIVNSMQCMLLDTDKTIEELTALCVALHNNHIVLAFTQKGLMPIASAHMYVFPYAKMNQKQLRILRRAILHSKRSFEASYQDVTYNVHGSQHLHVDGVLILFAASCLLLHGLTTANWAKHGYSYFPLDKANVSYYMNSTCFTIIHACNMRAGAAFAASQLLRKHGVSIET